MPARVAIWIGGRRGHPYTKVAKHLESIILSMDGFVTRLHDSKALLVPSHMKLIDAIVSYTQGGWDLDETEEDALFSFIEEQGGGFVGVHGATASFKNNPKYHDFLGARFSGHGLPRKFTCVPVDEKHPVMTGIGKFTIRDEPYIHEMRENVQVLMIREDDQEPVVYVKEVGKGRIVYMAFGHSAKIFKNNQIARQLIKNALSWSVDEV